MNYFSIFHNISRCSQLSYLLSFETLLSATEIFVSLTRVEDGDVVFFAFKNYQTMTSTVISSHSVISSRCVINYIVQK